MSADKKIICCCEAGQWVLVFAWLQIILCALAAAWFLMFLVGVSLTEVTKDKKDARAEALVFVSLSLVASIMGVILGVLLLFGTKKEKSQLLWTWIVITVIVTILTILSTVFQALRGARSDIFKATFFTAVNMFMVYVVKSRITDIQKHHQMCIRPYTSGS